MSVVTFTPKTDAPKPPRRTVTFFRPIVDDKGDAIWDPETKALQGAFGFHISNDQPPVMYLNSALYDTLNKG